MPRMPERFSLVTQLADILREGIFSGEWARRLPSTRELSEQLRVSRPTIRLALKLLRKEGCVNISHGRRTEIVLSSRRRKKLAKSNVIGFLSPIPLNNLSYMSLYLICDLQRHLADRGYKLEIHTETRFRRAQPFKALEQLVRQTRAACWILHFSTLEIQRWFSQRGIPTLVSKSRHETVNLPSFDLDHKAIGRHAAGTFLSLGHRRVGLLTLRDSSASDMSLLEGFREGFAASASGGGEPLVSYHDGTVREIRSALMAQFRLRETPTGLLVSGAAATLATLGHLTTLGLRVPADVSVICNIDDPMLAYCVPSVARYRINPELHAKRLSRLVIQLASSGSLPARKVQVMPQFCRCETLAPRQNR